MRVVLLALPFLFAGCWVGDGGGGDKATPGPQAEQFDLSTFDPNTLIFWEGFTFLGSEIPPRLESAFRAMEASGDPRWEPYFFDLMTLPTPYQELAFEALRKRYGDFGDFGPFEWIEERGFREPEQDTPDYLAFKQRLFSSIQQAIGDFLDPRAQRLISAQEVLWGGVCVDCIPPLETPEFVTPAQASSWIHPSDQVIGIEINGDVRAYPRRIIDWHEMVNDIIGGTPVSLAYCTLCGSAILYDARVDGQVFSFGTSGMLYRSNKLMYDRNTRTLWEQYTGEPVWGQLVGSGIQLKVLPVVHTSYDEWLRDHPDTKVLDIETGFRRDYGSGVAYREYFRSPQLMFPAPDRSGPLQPKDVVYAVRLDGQLTAYPVKLLAERGFIQDTVAGRKVVVLATADGSGGRAYEAGSVTFESYDRKGDSLRSSDGRQWRMTEAALVSGVESLARAPGHNSFWFSVINHTENGRLYGQ